MFSTSIWIWESELQQEFLHSYVRMKHGLLRQEFVTWVQWDVGLFGRKKKVVVQSEQFWLLDNEKACDLYNLLLG